MISGKLCKKLIESEMPYELQLILIHDNENKPENIKALILDYYKVKKAIDRIQRYDLRDKIRLFFFPPTVQTKCDA